MTRTIVGALIFSLTLLAGIQAAIFIKDVTARLSIPDELPEPGSHPHTGPAPKAPDGVRVSHIGVEDSALRFLVYNGSTETLSCHGSSGLCLATEIRIDGLDANAWVCMNGTDIYEIKPGGTVEMMVTPDDFARVPAKNDQVAVGFRSIADGPQNAYFAVPIVIPSAFRNEIRKAVANVRE